jgi:predicted TIM-barrel fold metal-dependent hydrolase
MPYAEGRRFYDADSHIMELPDFLREHADPAIRDQIPPISVASGGVLGEQGADVIARGAHTPEQVEKLVGLGDDLISGPKGYLALGAFNSAERTRALDQLGFDRQLVFATFSAGMAFAPQLGPDLMYGTARAHNRAMAAFCADDERLMCVGAVPLDDPERALRELDAALELGAAAVWIPHRDCGGRSPGHDDLDPFWARLAEAGVPFVLHVGGAPLQQNKAWLNTGRAVPTDWLGGGENVRGKDMTSLHHGPEQFLSTLVLDGVLERHPGLRGGAIELGAGWVPSMLRRVDWIAEIWRRSEPELAARSRRPSEQITEQLAFTPYPFEDVGSLIRESNPDLYLFSSDYPHIEGGRHPLGRFGKSLEAFDEPVLERFYSGNFAELFGLDD